MEVTIPVAGTYSRHIGPPELNNMEQSRIPPGRYAVRVFVGGIGGVHSQLVPIEVR